MQNKIYKKLAGEWFYKAEDDLGVAKLLFKEKSFPASVCFHTHQAAEKYLKGFLVYYENDIEKKFKIHNLLKLFDYCKENNKDLPISLKEHCFALNRYYSETRYPMDVPEYSWQEVKETIEAVEDLKEGLFKFIE